MWKEIVTAIIEVCIIPMLGILTKYLVAFIDSKIKLAQETSKNELVYKYLGLADEIISTCVTATTQTYVSALKEKDLFDEEAQHEAFYMTYTAVKGLLTQQAQEVLKEATGDLEEFLLQSIEAKVNQTK